MADDLVAFLRARLIDDERGVHEWTRQPADGLLTSSLRPIHEWVQRDGAVRVLREVEARKLRLAEIERELADDPTDATALWLLRVEALPYADQHGYRMEWHPEGRR